MNFAQIRLGRWIAARRAERGISEMRLALEVGCPAHFVYLYESGQRRPDEATLRRMVAFFDAVPAERAPWDWSPAQTALREAWERGDTARLLRLVASRLEHECKTKRSEDNGHFEEPGGVGEGHDRHLRRSARFEGAD